MLRLTVSPGGSGETILQVDGWLTGDDVELLKRERTRNLATGASLVLDLKGLRFADRAGAELLRGWSRGGVELLNASPFVQCLIDDR